MSARVGAERGESIVCCAAGYSQRARRAIARLEPYDFILDSVGKARTSALKEACKATVSRKDRFVSIDDGPLLLNSERLDRIRELVEAKKIIPITDRCFPLEQIIEAHQYVELGHKRGNVALTVNRVSEQQSPA